MGESAAGHTTTASATFSNKKPTHSGSLSVMPPSMQVSARLPDLPLAAWCDYGGASGDTACGGHRRRHRKAAPERWRTCAAPRKSHHAQALLIAHAPELFGTASDARAACGAAYKTNTAPAGPPSGVTIKGVPRAHSCAHHPQTSVSQHLRPCPAAVSCSARHCCLQSVAARRSKWR